MKHFSVRDAKNQLPALIRAVEAGEQVVITRNGRPVVDVVPHARRGGIDFAGYDRWRKERGYTLVAGPIPDDFDDPLPEDFLLRPLP